MATTPDPENVYSPSVPSWFDLATDGFRATMATAGNAARQDGVALIQARHLAIGLVRQQGGNVGQLWQRRDFDRQRALDALGGNAPAGAVQGSAAKFDDDSRTILASAMLAAATDNSPQIGTEHLLLALLQRGPAEVVAVFAEQNLGVDSAQDLIDQTRHDNGERLVSRPGWRATRGWRRMRRRVR